MGDGGCLGHYFAANAVIVVADSLFQPQGRFNIEDEEINDGKYQE